MNWKTKTNFINDGSVPSSLPAAPVGLHVKYQDPAACLPKWSVVILNVVTVVCAVSVNMNSWVEFNFYSFCYLYLCFTYCDISLDLQCKRPIDVHTWVISLGKNLCGGFSTKVENEASFKQLETFASQRSQLGL